MCLSPCILSIIELVVDGMLNNKLVVLTCGGSVVHTSKMLRKLWCMNSQQEVVSSCCAFFVCVHQPSSMFWRS